MKSLLKKIFILFCIKINLYNSVQYTQPGDKDFPN